MCRPHACNCLFRLLLSRLPLFFFFFFNDTATTEIYTLSLHDALPILCSPVAALESPFARKCRRTTKFWPAARPLDRKSTRLNSSHQIISYAVFCLKKKKKRHKVLADKLRDDITHRVAPHARPHCGAGI